MTDREEFLALIAKWGLIPDKEPQRPGAVSFTAESGELSGRRVEGYRNFTAIFDFYEDGKFASLGIWE